MLSDWVKGVPLEALTQRYFPAGSDDEDNLSMCVKKFKRLAMTSSWGLASVLAMKFGKKLEELPPDVRESVTNIPSMVLYGVWTKEQIALRSAGVPRNAALDLSKHVGQISTPFALRKALKAGGEKLWTQALGEARGADYFRIWRILEG